jgi:uncharacterized protein YukE
MSSESALIVSRSKRSLARPGKTFAGEAPRRYGAAVSRLSRETRAFFDILFSALKPLKNQNGFDTVPRHAPQSGLSGSSNF